MLSYLAYVYEVFQHESISEYKQSKQTVHAMKHHLWNKLTLFLFFHLKSLTYTNLKVFSITNSIIYTYVQQI